MTMQDQMPKAKRKEMLLNVGAKLAAKYGAKNVKRAMVAEAAKVSQAIVSLRMGPFKTAQLAYARRAKKLGLSEPSAAKQAKFKDELNNRLPRGNYKPKPGRAPTVRKVRAPSETAVIPTVPSQLPPLLPPL